LNEVLSDNAADDSKDNVQNNTQNVVKKETQKSGVTESQAEYNQAKEDGVFSFLWAAILAGFAALTTPCVYPMIPITCHFLLKGQKKLVLKVLQIHWFLQLELLQLLQFSDCYLHYFQMQQELEILQIIHG